MCRRYAFPGEDFWRGAEKITYFIFFPSLLLYKLSQADVTSIHFSEVFILIFLMLLIVSIIIIFSKPLLDVSSAKFTSIFQGGIRFNTYVGLAVVSSLYGAQGLVVAVIMIAIMVPLINILCVVILIVYGDRDNVANVFLLLIKGIITNPLILACALGIVLSMFHLELPIIIQQVLLLFSQVALPLGLLAVGAALNLQTIKQSLFPVFVSSVFKFLLLPAIAILLCYYLEVDRLQRDVLFALTLLPTATASYILAKQMGGDAELMAATITLQTLLSAVWIPLAVLTASYYLV